MELMVGDIVKTSYDSGPYKIVKISGPCTCPSFHDSISRDKKVRNRQRPEHYHFTCIAATEAAPHYHRGDGNYYLSPFRLDGTSVDSDDYLILLRSEPAQLSLI